MRRLAVAGIVLATCTLAAAAQDSSSTTKDTSTTSSGNWFTRMFSSGDKPDAKKAADAKKAEPVHPVDTPAAIQARENIVLNRRLAVILKLREVAILGNDTVLLRKADELEERANDIYFQRTAGLMVRANAPAAKGKGGEDER